MADGHGSAGIVELSMVSSDLPDLEAGESRSGHGFRSGWMKTVSCGLISNSFPRYPLRIFF